MKNKKQENTTQYKMNIKERGEEKEKREEKEREERRAYVIIFQLKQSMKDVRDIFIDDDLLFTMLPTRIYVIVYLPDQIRILIINPFDVKSQENPALDTEKYLKRIFVRPRKFISSVC